MTGCPGQGNLEESRVRTLSLPSPLGTGMATIVVNVWCRPKLWLKRFCGSPVAFLNPIRSPPKTPAFLQSSRGSTLQDHEALLWGSIRMCQNTTHFFVFFFLGHSLAWRVAATQKCQQAKSSTIPCLSQQAGDPQNLRKVCTGSRVFGAQGPKCSGNRLGFRGLPRFAPLGMLPGGSKAPKAKP